jgi:hypothetical protein
MNIIKKIRLFWSFKSILRKNKVLLEGDFNIRIDRANRLYTVLNVPEESFGEPYNLRTADIEVISQTYIREYIQRLSTFLNQIGLSELYDFYEPIKKVEKYSFLIVLGFKPFDSVKYNSIVYYRIIPIAVFLMLVGLIFLIF